MKAILSDIHGNLEALRAVLADIARHDIEAIYCLGDTIGYGPNPRECVEIAMQWNTVLLGNMDHAATFDPPDLGPTAIAVTRSLAWTRKELNVALSERESVGRRWKFLAERPLVHREGNLVLVHGSPRNPLYEYIFPEDIYNSRKMDRIFALVEHYCFQGHTHVPGIFTESLPEDHYQFHAPDKINYVYRLDGRKTLCNVGSVGQPRDGDWRACYVLLDGDVVRFRRVEYDIEATIRKIEDIDDLDDFFGDRLGGGR
jgi:diadenosine tetraphosphatase ApaH/serine/threonine PP2A family protein phosphatase